MLRLLIDESVNHRIASGLRRRVPSVELLLPNDAGVRTLDDLAVLASAEKRRCVLVTSDVRTMPGFAMERLAKGFSMPGMVVVPQSMALGQAVTELHLILETLEAADMDGVVLYLPL